MKKGFFLIVMCICLFTSWLFGQSCGQPGVKFDTQQEIDDFATTYPGCKVWSLGMLIEGSDITNLLGLSQLEKINGNLVIRNTTLLGSLHGLNFLDSIMGTFNLSDNLFLKETKAMERLSYVGEGFKISSNRDLTSINGFNQLRTSAGSVYIEDNDSLRFLTGLSYFDTLSQLYVVRNPNLRNLDRFGAATAAGDITISFNDRLETLFGLFSLRRVHGAIYITSNPKLIQIYNLNGLGSSGITTLSVSYNPSLLSLDGLFGITSVASTLFIVENDKLENLNGLNNLITVGNDLAIQGNGALSSLTDLSKLKQVEGDFILRSNNNLTSLEGLENVDFTQSQHVEIKHNFHLNTCVIENLCTYLNMDLSSDISTNGSNCSAEQTIKNFCNGLVGCTNPFAHNYDSSALEDDGSCETCFDNIRNGDEIVADCGGALCGGTCVIQGANCPTSLDLNGFNVVTGVYKSNQTVLTNNAIDGNVDVRLESGQDIEFQNNFQLNIGSRIEALIQNCVPD